MSDKEIKNVLALIKEKEIKFLDLHFTDTRGADRHASIPTGGVDANFFTEGKMFDGSSVPGWRSINNSDLVLMPDLSTAVINPFCESATLNMRCDIYDPISMGPYDRDPRSVAKRAEAFLISTGIADQSFFGSEPEFFIFDDVRWKIEMNRVSYELDSEEGAWNADGRIMV